MWFRKKRNILVTGVKGQLGSYLVKELGKLSFKKASSIGQVFGIGREDLELSNPEAVADFFNKNVADPSVDIDYVIHCAAATDTAAIEKDPFAYYASNVIATKNVAESCAYNGIRMIHISTDYVLSELSPIGSNDVRIEFPVNQYGLQKLLAEKEAQLAYFKAGHPEKLLIGRVSWLFGNSQKSFIEKFLKNMFKAYADAKKAGTSGQVQQKVVDDAYGKPTSVGYVLSCVLDAIDAQSSGVHDFQCTYASQISRFDWAKMVWQAFWQMLGDKCELIASQDDKIKEMFNDMHDRLEITPVKSYELHLSMLHPGLVQSSSAAGDMTPYVDWTQQYINDNAQRLVNMMVKNLKEVQ